MLLSVNEKIQKYFRLLVIQLVISSKIGAKQFYYFLFRNKQMRKLIAIQE